MPRPHAARILMVAALLLMTFLVGFPAGHSLGAVSHAGQPTLGEVQQELDQCRSELADLKANLPIVAAKLKQARAGTLVLAILPGAATAIPVDLKAWQALIALDLIEGKITPAQHDRLEARIRTWQATTVATLESEFNGASAAEQPLQEHCAALERQRNQLLGGGTIFKLVPSLTKVVNTHAPELIIDPTAGTGIEKHCCDGGAWDDTYTWKVPDTVVPGTTYQVPVGIEVTNVKPERELTFYMTVLAQGFAEQYIIYYPHPTGGTKTFDIAVPSDLSGSKEYFLQIGLNSSSVTYTYQP